jgi:hypothetical protein
MTVAMALLLFDGRFYRLVLRLLDRFVCVPMAVSVAVAFFSGLLDCRVVRTGFRLCRIGFRESF